MKRILILISLVLLLALPASGKNRQITVLDDVNVSTVGGAVTVITNVPNAVSGYFIFRTGDEVAAASLVVTIYIYSDLGEVLLLTSAAVGAANAQREYLIGTRGALAGSGIDDRSIFPMMRRMKFVFTVTGAGASFDVSAWLETIGTGAP
jgi:F0F1-type ATP synthase assembly protein I